MGNITLSKPPFEEIIQTLQTSQPSMLNTSAIPDQVTHADPCSYENQTDLEIRYYLIGVAGFLICTIGIVFNIVLLKILLQPSLRTTYLIYLSVLAIIDINIAVTYIVVMSLATWYEYFNNYFLYCIWHTCLPYFFTLSRVATLASSYLIVACTGERYLEVMQLYMNRSIVRITHTKRYVMIACVIFASIAFRAVVFWELDVVTNEDCRGTFSYYSLNRTWLIHDFYYSKVYSFYALHVVQVFLPFLILFILNFLIVRKWRIVLRRDTIHNPGMAPNGSIRSNGENQNGHRALSIGTSLLGSNEQSEKEEIRKRVKCAQSARAMMLAIVTSYLLCNLLNVVLTFLEHLASDLLHEHGTFYSFASDTVTLLTVVNATVRLPIYYGSNLKIRAELVRMIRECTSDGYSKSRTPKRPSVLWWVRERKRNQKIQKTQDDSMECGDTGVVGDGEAMGAPSEMTPLCDEETFSQKTHTNGTVTVNM